MATNRYMRRRLTTTTGNFYTKMFEARGVGAIDHYTTPIFTDINQGAFAAVTTTTHVWAVGDHFYKLAHEHYGDTEYWWVIALFNKRPTEAHIKNGTVVYIPHPPEAIARHARG